MTASCRHESIERVPLLVIACRLFRPLLTATGAVSAIEVRGDLRSPGGQSVGGHWRRLNVEQQAEVLHGHGRGGLEQAVRDWGIVLRQDRRCGVKCRQPTQPSKLMRGWTVKARHRSGLLDRRRGGIVLRCR